MEINYKNISLKPILESDLELLRSWRNDKELCKYLRDIGNITKEDQYNWYLKQKEDKNSITFAIHETVELNRLVGSLSLYDIKQGDKAEIGKILIGDPDAHGKKIGQNAMQALIDYGFKTYNLKTIYLGVQKNNIVAYTIYKSLGFVTVGERITCSGEKEELMIIERN